MPESSDRDVLIDVAERLFARKGVHGVSLREITLAAQVRSKSAVQYHFGGRDGLVREVLARRGETLRVKRAMSLEQIVVAGSEAEPRTLCKAIVEPYCEFLESGPGALSYLVIVREVFGDPQYAYEDLPSVFADPLLPVLVTRLLAPLGLPDPVAGERSLVAVSSVVGSVADRARRQLDDTSTRPLTPVPLFVSNLVDMLESAILAPVDPATMRSAALGPPPEPTGKSDVNTSTRTTS
jgi:AcrR family transcriptional regulator